jgi:hypothetical protein
VLMQHLAKVIPYTRNVLIYFIYLKIPRQYFRWWCGYLCHRTPQEQM